ncbi:LacI family DNA-binding transcriptional regulator [Weissella diestrammenae]|uniref:LacI family DNA-binding transcriptional regulator n=1 Tax=Weissella diestrammenae TaxID=1162633 RepID=A0A7G9T7E6_9LACO|nr:LacI family DNA-binding transcriptional regulator [Weissella diestrammenae]MCM0582036.1 LacI family DNA-binding transcriptional regulator [Weissella diestrammenae]QNN76021.1 LacI family DNA-binding transcriptional regulator [Weissella diestrammenae]
MKKASIKDVASRAGVSIATVSQIINHKADRFSQETIDRVFAARDELGYIANGAAKKLKGVQSPMIGVIIPSFRIPFFADIVQSMQLNAPERVNLVFMGAENEKIESSIYSLVERGVDALIFGRPIPNHQEVNEFLKKRDIPFLVLDQNTDVLAPDRIVADEFGGGMLAAAHLLNLGHKKIAIVKPNEMTDNMFLRLEGFIRTLSREGLKPIIQCQTLLSKHGGLHVTDTIIKSGATAVFALNDEMAIGLMRGLAKQGIDVPAQISIVGYDDTDYAEFVTPTLTTIAQPVKEIGAAALHMIVNRLEQTNLPQQTETFELHLVHRESTKALNSRDSR